MTSLDQKRIVIIGGTSGIGLATAKIAAEQGAHLVITGFKTDGHEETKTQLKGKAEILQLDIGSEAAVKNFFSSIGEFDYLTTPGSVLPKGSFLSMDSQKDHKKI